MGILRQKTGMDRAAKLVLKELGMAALQIVGALQKGHFVYASGQHGPEYVNKDALQTNPRLLDFVAGLLALPFCFNGHGFGAVVGAEKGGITLAFAVAHRIINPERGLGAAAAFAEKDGEGGFVLRRGFDKVVAHKSVLVVEDILTTGESAKRVVEAVRAAHGCVMGVSAIFNRGKVTATDLDVPELFSLIEEEMVSYPADSCPLCDRDVPINTEFGHGAKFLATQGR